MEPSHPTNTPTAQTTTTPPAPVAGSKALAITSLVLAIVSVVIGLIWFVAAPVAIVALVLGIVALVKRANGKGRSIAAVIIAGISLVIFVPFWALVSLVALSGIQQAADEYRVDAEYQTEQQSEGTSELFN